MADKKVVKMVVLLGEKMGKIKVEKMAASMAEMLAQLKVDWRVDELVVMKAYERVGLMAGMRVA